MFKSIISSVAVLTVTIAFIACTSESPTNPVSTDKSAFSTTDQYIVVMDDNSGTTIQSMGNTSREVSSLMGTHGIPQSSLMMVYDNIIKGFCAKLNPAQLEALKSDKMVKYIEKDQVVTVSDPLISVENPKSDKMMAQMTPWGITFVGGSVDATATTGIAWIVDTGINLTHPDLNVNKTLSKSFITTGSDALTADDLNGHGSHVSGTIAGKNNTIGVVGVCAGAELVAVKVLNYAGSGTISGIINGLNYVKSNLVAGRINVVNMSLGGGISTTLDNAVVNLAAAGAYVVVAAGNSYKNISGFSPARANGTRVFTISASDNLGKFAYFSNYGAGVDFAAPGVSVYSCYKGGAYATMSGTSMAAPHVVGILLATNGTVNSLKNVLYDPDGIPDKEAHR